MKFRPEAEVWPLMTDDQLKALAQDIDERGQLNPIYLYEGDILDGRNRWLAITRHCKKTTRPKFDDARTDSPIAFVVSLNEKRRHLNDSQRQMAAAKALPFYEKEAGDRRRAAQQEAGKNYGRGRPKAAIASAPIGAEPKAEPSPQPPAPTPAPRRASADAAQAFGTSDRGVQRGAAVLAKGSKKLVEAVESGNLTMGKAEEIVKQYPDKHRQDSQVAAIAKSKMATRVKGLTGEVEWYTPREYLDAAVEVMGAIELDPASSEHAQAHVKAIRYFTAETDGLRQQWAGRVWLNPPYAMPFIKQFVHKMTTSYDDGDISEGILLTNNATDTEWFHTATASCAAVCFTRGRISFLKFTDGELVEKLSPTHGQAFFYFGSNLDQFCKVFKKYGTVVVPKALVEFRGDSVWVDEEEP